MLASLFAPLVLLSAFYFPYIVPKTLFFQAAVECALFFYILLAVLDKAYAPKFDRISKAVLVFFAAYALAGAFGANPARSFLGTYERMLSVVNLAHYIAFFVIARSVFTGVKDWLIFLRTFVTASVLVSVYGVAQKLGLSGVYHSSIDRIDSTIGNAAFLGGYLIFAVCFALALFLLDRNRTARILYALSIVLNLAVIYLTGTRGAALGLAVGLVLLAAAYLFRPAAARAGGREMAGWITAALCAVVGLVALLELQGGGVFDSLRRFTSVSLSDATVQTRILSASTSWSGFLERPVFGWGPENYNLVFDKYYNPKLYPTENWFDHAHNIFFDTLTATGAVGFIAYFFLLGMLAWVIARGARAAPEAYWLRMVLFALLGAYFVQNIFVFDSLASYLPFFMLAAYAAAGFPHAEEKVASDAKKEKLFRNPVPLVAAWLVPVFLLGMYWVNIRPATAAYYTVEALKTDRRDSAQAQVHFERALAKSTFGRHEIRGKLADFASEVFADERVTDEERKKAFAEYVFAEMERSIVEDPLNFRNYLYFANYLAGNHAVLTAFGIPALVRADAVLAEAEALAPNKPPLYLQWGKVKSLRGEHEKAVELFERAVALKPDVVDSQFRLASAYRAAGKDDKALALYMDIAKGEGLNAQAYVDLAVGFANLGRGKEAIAAAQKAAELDPTLQDESDGFINEVNSKLIVR